MMPLSMSRIIKSVDAYGAQVELLMHFDGVNGGTSFVDSSQRARLISSGGSVTTSAAQYKFGGASGWFIGSDSASLYVGYAAGFDLSVADFTIEGWFRPEVMSGSSNYGHILSKRYSPTDFDYALYTEGPDRRLAFAYGVTGSGRINLLSPANTLTVGLWFHFAVVRSGANLSMYVNGVGVATQMITGSIRNRNLTLRIGGSNSFGDDFLNGFLDDFRLTKGAARYTDNFTPPSAPFPNP